MIYLHEIVFLVNSSIFHANHHKKKIRQGKISHNFLFVLLNCTFQSFFFTLICIFMDICKMENKIKKKKKKKQNDEK